MADSKHITLNTGRLMPVVGFGTFLCEPGQVATAVREALRIGYRHIDCAECYENQAEIGAVFDEVFNDAKTGIRREDVFITSKLWLTDFHPSKVRAALQKALTDLKLTYLDLYLIHIPVACARNEEGNSRASRRAGFSLIDTWRVLEAAHDEGVVKAIGVSNYPAALLNDLQNGCRIMPAVNQIERHPYLTQPDNINFIKSLGVSVTAYAPLGAPGICTDEFKAKELKVPLENDVVLRIAVKHNKSAAQVLIRWSVDSGIVVIPKSVSPNRIAENFNVFDFRLDADDVAAINALNRDLRTFKQDWMGIPTFA